MQAINRIQNAIINANAGIQGALVVDRANAHRAYPSLMPCDMKRVSKRSPQPSRERMPRTVVPVTVRDTSLVRVKGLPLGTTGQAWRRDRHHAAAPATKRATFVLSDQNCR